MSLNAVADGVRDRARSARGARMTTPGAPPVLLRVRNLKTYFVTEYGKGTARAVDDVSFDLYPAKRSHRRRIGVRQDRHVALDSPSRAGAARPRAPRQPDRIRGRNLLALSAPELRAVRGNQIAMNLSGADDVAEPRVHGRGSDCRSRHHPSAPVTAARRGPARSRCCACRDSRSRRGVDHIPISSRAACASAS